MNNKTSLMIIAGLLTMATTVGSISASVQAETFEISDHPTSMQILSLINMYNQNNPNNPIVCSSGFVFPQEESHSSSVTSITNQIGQVIDDAVAGVHVPSTGQNHHQHQQQHNNNNNSNNHNSQETIDMAKRTSTPVDIGRNVDSSSSSSSSDNMNNDSGSDDDNDNGGESSDDNNSSGSSDSSSSETD